MTIKGLEADSVRGRQQGDITEHRRTSGIWGNLQTVISHTNVLVVVKVVGCVILQGE